MSDEAQNGNVTDFAALLAFLAETPNQLAHSTSGLSNQELRFQNSPEEFSVLENLCHLRDLERQGYTPRIRRILAEVDPALADFDGARVAAESDYNNEQPGSALEAFQAARQQNVAVLRTLTEGQLNREGNLAGVGKVTLRRLAEMICEHDEGHLADLRALRRRLERSRELTR